MVTHRKFGRVKCVESESAEVVGVVRVCPKESIRAENPADAGRSACEARLATASVRQQFDILRAGRQLETQWQGTLPF